MKVDLVFSLNLEKEIKHTKHKDSEVSTFSYILFSKNMPAVSTYIFCLLGIAPQIAPPPKSPVGNAAFSDNGPRFNPFDKGELSAFSAQEG